MQGAGVGVSGGVRAAYNQVRTASQLNHSDTNTPQSSTMGKIKQGAIGGFKYAGAVTLGAGAGTTSGFIKGASGHSTFGAGDKGGRMSGKLFTWGTSKQENSHTTTPNPNIMEGTIAKANEAHNSGKPNESSSNSNYISGVPKSEL